MIEFTFETRTKLIFGPGCIRQIGDTARSLGFKRTLLVCDRGLVAAGHGGRATNLLHNAGIDVYGFHDFQENPDSGMIEVGRQFAENNEVDSIVALGGGSSLDCAKGINFVLTNGGRMQDYWGYGKAVQPLLPMIGVPTTTGTGSEAQSYALITDAATHRKMACGDPKAAFQAALLDPELAASQPRQVLAVTGYDAISHAVETFVSTRRNPMSECFSREAWDLLSRNYERALHAPRDIDAIGEMQLGAFLAGLAIENSMLGATHACANPLTQRYGTTHGIAIAQLLSHVVKWNSAEVGARYKDLHSELPERLRDLARAGGLPVSLSETEVPKHDIPLLAEDAVEQWTGRFNPRPFSVEGALEIYECAY
jgi:alcohol dehydrogenase